MSITNNQSQLFRMTYEAYSKFANGINRCLTLKEVSEVCITHLKYLLNFKLIRMVMEENNKFVFFELSGSNIQYDFKNESSLYAYENDLLKNGIPVYTSKIPSKLWENKPDLEQLVEPKLWAWNFDKYDRKVIVSLLADEEKPFSSGDIEILKLAVDCIQAKFNEIYLKRQLAIQNRNLSEAYHTIKLKNQEIQNIVENQKKTIKDGVREISEKNKKLLHISVLNSHNVREPLSRIQGIIQLFDVLDDETCKKELIPKLKSSAEEMDNVLQEVIEMASRELSKLKAEKI
ncbi:histidine kinase [Gramella jeungdoensis]|uniref:Histidine kinase n=1 Tax=Gramella jeungdoensis TaxID=708091 RepID=A0ABT0YXN7_9FLAO|nr:histidine kinase [Gramella jeungdoensis]MCM8568235.1 histidine kinase [Gramella jeungdoensis]